MNAQQLKNSILQEAIEGRLVTQDPNDEPASVLLDKIRKEKARLVKEGKLKKKDLEETPISEEEIPFNIPDSWTWVRFGTITINRDRERIPLSVDERSKLEKKYDYYGASGVIDKVDRYLFDKPLLLIGEDGANLINRSTPIAFIAKGQYWVNNHAHVLDYFNEDLMQYVCWFINAISLVDYVTGTAQPKMNQEKMNSILVALPPLAEQKRIVAKIEELLPKVEEYGKAQESLDKLNEELPERLKKSILQEAIEGRLVPQDPNDEPASVLLDKIRAEKKRLVKEGKLKKKDLEENPISEDEKPFEIPESWEWVRIDQIATSQLGKTLDKGKQTGQEYPYLCSINVYWDGIDLSKVKSFLLREEELEKYKLKRGDLLVCEGGDYGRCSVWDSDDEMYYQNALHRIRFFGGLSVYFYKYIFEQYRNIDYIVGQGQTIKHFTYANMKSLAFPLPPLAEQHRIVEKIEQLMKEIDKLKV